MSQREPFLQQVRDSANTTLDLLLGQVNDRANNISNTVSVAQSTAAAAYTQANNAFSEANTAFSAATTGIAIAEAAYAEANAAYAQANTATAAASAAQATATSANAATGVSPSTYGSGLAIPVFTVDARGKITGVTNTGITPFGVGSDGIVKATGTTSPAYFINAQNQAAIPPNFSTSTPGYAPAPGTTDARYVLTALGWAIPLAGGAQSAATNGYTTLPGGIILQWGQFNQVAGVVSHGYNINFPNNVFNVQATLASSQGTEFWTVMSSPAPSRTSWSFYQNNSGLVNWFAIGN